MNIQTKMDSLAKPKNVHDKKQTEISSPCNVVPEKGAIPKRIRKLDISSSHKRVRASSGASVRCKLPKQETGCTSLGTKSQVSSRPVKETFISDEIDLSSSLKRDVDTLSFVFPNKDRKTIKDLLIRNKKNKNRLQLVSEFISDNMDTKDDEEDSLSLKTESGTVLNILPSVDSGDVLAILVSLPASPNRAHKAIEILSKSLNDQPKASMSASSPTSLMTQDFQILRKIFPDESPERILDLLQLHEVDKERLQIVSNALCERRQEGGIESEDVMNLAFVSKLPRSSVSDLAGEQGRNNPQAVITDVCETLIMNQPSDTLDDLNKTDDRDETKADLQETNSSAEESAAAGNIRMKSLMTGFTLDEFLEKYPNPDETFRMETDKVSKLYQRHVIFALQITFPFLETKDLELTLDKHNHHFYPSYLEVITAQEMSLSNHPKVDISLTPFSYETDERLYAEWWYIHNEQKVTEYLSMKEIPQLIEPQKSKNKQLFQCCCCCKVEYISEDLLTCSEGHLFCKICLVRYAEAAFRDGKMKFPCLNDQCDKILCLSTLQRNLPSDLCSKIFHRIEMEENQQANVPNLVTCPYCPFATIMPNPNDKVFKCLNPKCLKVSYRIPRKAPQYKGRGE